MRIPVACGIDAKYFVPLLVMLTSLREKLAPAVDLDIYLFHSGLTEADLERVRQLGTLHVIDPPARLIAKLPTTALYPPVAAFPMLLPELTDLERVLFIDADVLVLDDVSKLWETPLEGKALGASIDSAVQICDSPRGVKDWRRLGIPPGATYMNCGVMLIDLVRWRTKNVADRVFAYLRESPGPNDFIHQEPLNAVLWDDWLRLSSRWNLLGTQVGRPFNTVEPEAWRDPGMVHFSGRLKPWLMPVNGPFADTYRRYVKQVTGADPGAPQTWTLRAESFYDRHLRDHLHPVEQVLWRRRWI